MGLLSRWRSGSGPGGVEASASPPVEPRPAAEEPVYRAATAEDIPDWAKLPPLQPSLPEMPRIVPSFESSLVSWQPPTRFLGELGHSISPSGPSGLVEGMTVIAPPQLASRPEESDVGPAPEPLPLATSSVGPAPKAPQRVWRLPWNRADPEPPTVTAQREAVAAPLSTPQQVTGPAGIHPDLTSVRTPRDQPAAPDLPLSSPASASETIEEIEPPDADGDSREMGPSDVPVAEVVGFAPLTPTVQLTVTAPEESPDNRLVSAPAPPDLPLAQLRSALLPPEPPGQPFARPEASQMEAATLPTEPVRVPPAPLTPGLVGQRAIVTESADVDQSPPAGPLPVDRGLPPGELPLASPLSADPVEDSAPVAGDIETATPLGPDAPAAPEPASADELSAAAPLLREGGQRLSVAPPVPAPSAVADDAAPTAELTLARQASEPPAPPVAAEDPTAASAPLLGHAPPVVAEPAPLVSGPPAANESLPADSGTAAPPESLLGRPPRPPVPRSGLGEPMSNLPASARSWNISSMSPAQQLQMSRAMIHRQTPGLARKPVPSEPHAQRLLAPAAEGQPASPEPMDTVLASTPLLRAALERHEDSAPEIDPGDIPPAGLEQAPLLSLQPLVGVDVTGTGPAPANPPPEGARIRTAVGQRHGVDLTHVPVDRTSQGASEAGQLRARAFTSDRAVVIPADVGTLETGPGEALFAHELTHVAQRMRLGPGLPSESSPAGRVLEAEALSAEMALAPAPLPVADLPGRSVQTSRSRVAESRSAASERGPVLPLAAAASATPDAESLAATIVEKLSAPSPAQAVGQPGQVFTPPWLSNPVAPAPAAVQRAEPVTDVTPSSPPPPEPIQQEQAGPFMNRPSDEELSNLSRWLFPLIRHRLKGELREDRERAGLLTDHYRRW